MRKRYLEYLPLCLKIVCSRSLDGATLSIRRFAKTHGKYTEEELNIELKHREPVTFLDKSALFAVKCVRFVFDAGK
jgi:hypothetical protein